MNEKTPTRQTWRDERRGCEHKPNHEHTAKLCIAWLWRKLRYAMRPLQQLDNRTLLVLKTALDEYQRYQPVDPDRAKPFLKIVETLIDPIIDLDIWNIRGMINVEDERRSRYMTIKVSNLAIFDALNGLGKQEMTVLRLIGEGHRSEYIQELLGISYRTLANHKAKITSKLHLGSARDLTKFAIDNLGTLQIFKLNETD